MSAVMEERVVPEAEESVILFCPVCCTPTDTKASQRRHVCPVCTQEWDMAIDLDRISEHSPA